MAEPAGEAVVAPAAREVLLGLADDDLLVGHRQSEWLGYAPVLEEDLAFASIAQDELGHAQLVYGLLTGGDPVAADQLAFWRPPEAYRSSWLCELATPTWHHALVRHLLYDLAEQLRWQVMTASTVPGLAVIARRVLLEERYHTLHARTLWRHMVDGTDESRQHMQEALDTLVPLAARMFEATPQEDEAVAEGVMACGSADLAEPWRAAVAELTGPASLEVHFPEPTGRAAPQGRSGVRSPDFAEAHDTMTAVLRLDPSARW